jgi:ATP-dependent Zn protease
MGPERRSHVMEEKVKLATAYHEVLAQHDQQLSLSSFLGRACTLCALYQGGDAIIQSYLHASWTCTWTGKHGFTTSRQELIVLLKTHMAPEGDRTSVTYTEFLAEMDVSTCGRAAEELSKCSFLSRLYGMAEGHIVYGKENITSGASSDLVQATRVARNMVRVSLSPDC